MASGDVLVATVAARVTASAALAAPAGWTLVRRDDCSGPLRTELSQALFYKVAGSSEPSSYTFGLPEATGAAGSVLAYAGVDSANPIDGSSGKYTRNTITIRAPSLTPTGEGRRLVVSFAHSGALSIPAPSGTSQRGEAIVSALPTVTAAVHDQALDSSAETGDKSTRLQAPQNCNLGTMVLLRPAGGSTTSPPPPSPPPPSPPPPSPPPPSPPPPSPPPPSPPPPSPPPPSPPPPSPPPPSPPPSTGGTTLTFTDATWTCDRPVTQYATSGLPLRVVMNYTRNYDGFGVRLGAGCTGDGTSALDLILEVKGDGRTYGVQHDAVRVMNALPGASNLQISGYANCGSRGGTTYHQDAIQVLGGTNLTWIDFQVGNYDAGLSTCQGAGGAFFYSLESVNTRVQGGKFVACNHSLNMHEGTGNITGASFRSGRNDGSDPACTYYSSNPCIFISSVTRGPNVTCERWNPSTRRWEPQGSTASN